jgi:uncharacterized protein YdiU (UPF0061 family)
LGFAVQPGAYVTEIPIPTSLQFDNSYALKLDGFYTRCQGDVAPTPDLVALNEPLAAELGLDVTVLTARQLAEIFSGTTPPAGAVPLAQAYAGHQFGGFSPQLGDGRALLLGEVFNKAGERQDIALKGSGRTPFSRGGDGKAVIGPVLREYIVAEAMFALGIPTTRALAAVTTGQSVMRENGPLPGAVLTRVAASHLRVGTFQYFAARGETDKLRQLADYAIARHYPQAQDSGTPYLALLQSVSQAQAELLAKWMTAGFVHGVMNTDNMTISGETIDYGPCAFMDRYDPHALYSSIDRQGRYAYGQQPAMARWNLARFAETLLPLIDADETRAIDRASAEVNRFAQQYLTAWTGCMRAKLGLQTARPDDRKLADDLLAAAEGQAVDYTLLFRRLSAQSFGRAQEAGALFDNPAAFESWFEHWQERLKEETRDPVARSIQMKQANPIYIPRNHKVEEALQSMEKHNNIAPFERLNKVLSHPFDQQDGCEEYAQPAPDDFGPYRTFCGT